MIVKAVIALVLGVLVFSILDYMGVLTHSINVLIGVLVGLLYFFGADRYSW